MRQMFAKDGTLTGDIDVDFRSIMDREPVFAFSHAFDLGRNANAGPVNEGQALFTFAHTQDPVVQYASARGLTLMKPLWKSYFPYDYELLNYHYLDFANARNLAANYSDQLAADAYRSGSDSYVDIVALSARQVMGATSFSGTPKNPVLFLKEISSNGNCQTVDVIFPAFPFFMYTNPRWLAYLLEPLLEHQLSGQYPNKYAMHDLGYHFPNETGHANGIDEYMPVEECGDMLIMSLALVNSLSYGVEKKPQSLWSALDNSEASNVETKGGDSLFPLNSMDERNGIDFVDESWGGSVKGHVQARTWLRRTYRLLKQWTGYLVEFSLEPHNQLSTDDFAGWLALQTNLALKGIIGIKAMSEMADIVGETVDAEYYRVSSGAILLSLSAAKMGYENIATLLIFGFMFFILQNISNSYIKRWEELGISRDKTHAKLAYNWYGSWTTLYSLFADAILCFHPSLTNPKLSSSSSSSSSSDQNNIINHNNNDINNNNAAAQSPLIQPQQHRHTNTNTNPRSNGENADFIPHHIYTRQTRWYAAVLQKYGLPLDSRHLYAKSDWEFEAAAVVTSPAVRASILGSVARWVNETATDRPLTDLYMTEGDGGFAGSSFFARPVVGAHFAFLALERACGGGLGMGIGMEVEVGMDEEEVFGSRVEGDDDGDDVNADADADADAHDYHDDEERNEL